MSESYQYLLLDIVDLYASQYGWTSEFIYENVYLDEFFIQRDIIDKRKRDDYKMLAHISLLQNRDEKGIKEFFEMLNGTDERNHPLENQTTDFDAILIAKKQIEQINKMN